MISSSQTLHVTDNPKCAADVLQMASLGGKIVTCTCSMWGHHSVHKHCTCTCSTLIHILWLEIDFHFFVIFGLCLSLLSMQHANLVSSNVTTSAGMMFFAVMASSTVLIKQTNETVSTLLEFPFLCNLYIVGLHILESDYWSSYLFVAISSLILLFSKAVVIIRTLCAICHHP